MIWSSYQEDIFDDFKSGQGNTAVDAVAGSGKSTTLIQALSHLPKNCTDVMMTSFSVQSTNDLKAKNPPWFVDVRTMNSLGNRAITQRFGPQKVFRERVYSLMDKVLGERPEDPVKRSQLVSFRMRVKALVDMAKSYLADDNNGLLEVADIHDMDLIVQDWIAVELSNRFDCAQEDVIIESAKRILTLCKQIDGSIDFNDQIWLPYVYQLPLEQFKMVIVDEGQDTNFAQMDLLIRSCKGRLIMAGENAQAIYAWRGAGLGLDPFIKRTKAKVLPLSISYRCPKAVVAEAAKLVPGIEASPTAIEGYVTDIPMDMLRSHMNVGDTILSRKNAPLIELFMSFLGYGIPVTMQGRELGEKLIRFIQKSKAKTANELIEYTKNWAKEEVEKRTKKNSNARVDHIEDHLKCIEILCNNGSNVDSIVSNVRKLMSAPEGNYVLLSTVHRAKGLEWDRVFLLHDTFPANWSYWMQYARRGNAREWADSKAKQVRAEQIEERNLMYVAITRSKRELIYVMPV
jgi:DNA helicase II / ATP-dependent DNA helicase PcrA